MLPLLLLACAPVDTPADLLAADAAPPPPTLTLLSSPAPGGPLDVRIDGAQPGAAWSMVVANGGIAPDAGVCPAALGGECLDIRPGSLGYRIIGTGTAPAGGVVSWSMTLPTTVPSGTYQLEAVFTSPQVVETNPVEFSITAACPTLAEPNNTQPTAADLTGDLAGLAVCPGDADWFAIDVAPESTLSVLATFSPGDGDLDLELVDAAGFPLDRSETLGGEEEVLWRNGSPNTTTVWLLAWAVSDRGNDGVRYELDMEQLQPAVCVDDAMEDDDLPADAHLITPGVQAGHASCAGDRDWFMIDLQANDQLTVGVDEDSAFGDVDVELYDARGTPITSGAVDPARYTATSPERVYIVTDLVSDDVLGGGNSYDLNVRVDRVALCSADMLEPNNNTQTATPAVPGTILGLMQCEADDDWYALSLQQGQRVEVNLTFNVADGDIDATVFGPNGAPVGGGTSGASDEFFSFTATSAGIYKMRIYLYGDYGPPITDGAVYDMEIR